MGRLRIVQETLRKEYEKLKIEIQEDLKEEIEELLKKEAEKYVYENTSSAVMERMRVIGKLMNRLIKECKLDEEQDNLLVRVFREQYQIKATENKVEIKEEGTEDSKSRDIAIIVGCDVENASTADSTYLEP